MVKILEIFGEVFEGKCGKVPCYNTVVNWMKKLGLSVYENDRTPCRGGKYAVVVDESIFINSEKLLLLLGIPARHKGEPVQHEDVTVISMKVGKAFNGDDIKQEIEELYGITPFVLLIPLYPKLVNKSVTDTFNFKERLVNVKLKDIDTWAAKNMSTNWVTERTKIFRKAI